MYWAGYVISLCSYVLHSYNTKEIQWTEIWVLQAHLKVWRRHGSSLDGKHIAMKIFTLLMYYYVPMNADTRARRLARQGFVPVDDGPSKS